MAVDQVLVNRRVVALEAQLGLDKFPMGLADGARRLGRSRWPGWRSLIGRAIWCAGGHPGGICLDLELLHAFGIGTYGLAINSSDAFNLAVAGVGLQQSR